jgi:predicted transcriptional regulator
MKRGGYAMDLTQQIKVRVDDNTFKKLALLSEERKKTRSWILRDFITRGIAQTFTVEM